MPAHSTGICFPPSAPFVNIIFISSIPAFLRRSYGRTIEPSIRKFLRSSPMHTLYLYQPDLQRIDEVMDIVELLCGEATFQGFELLRHDYLDQEERLVGTGFTNVAQH
jgi:hypothetical protein